MGVHLIGNHSTGKTSLANVKAFDHPLGQQEYVPCGFEAPAYSIYRPNAKLYIQLEDFPIAECFNPPGNLTSIHPASVILLCYSVDNRNSFECISEQFHPMLAERGLTAFILVATRIDLRCVKNDCVTTQEGLKLAREIKAAAFVECSSYFRVGLRTLFDELIPDVAMQDLYQEAKKKERCVVN
eukprot:TRINITY_DN3297_c0_g1_i1.p1 TRINITY_DN3297_c0_g1~~TRINITY_DN3297_c0_g1_i1.p1  ORF type:complete len:194 (+),score=43.89 TRINITY_DN3297_c0_g1_i1:32-583(+)